MRGAQASGGARERFPDTRRELDGLQILGQIVQTAEQGPRVLEAPQARRSKAGSDAQPLLLSEASQHTILDLGELHREGRSSAGGLAEAARDLHQDLLAVADALRLHFAAIELGDQRLSQQRGCNRTVKGALFHSEGTEQSRVV